tara:strand:- start:509 stop:826 length:318 start_codon:yes stop_codon:yes gene_type:complete
MSKVIETTKFTLNLDVSLEVFLLANREVNEWIEVQPGFHSRFLTQKADESWLDIIIWENEEAANKIDELFYEALGNSKFMQLLNPESVETSFSNVVVTLSSHHDE